MVGSWAGRIRIRIMRKNIPSHHTDKISYTSRVFIFFQEMTYIEKPGYHSLINDSPKNQQVAGMHYDPSSRIALNPISNPLVVSTDVANTLIE